MTSVASPTLTDSVSSHDLLILIFAPQITETSRETELLEKGHRKKNPPTKLVYYILQIITSLGLKQSDCKYHICDYTTCTCFQKNMRIIFS